MHCCTHWLLLYSLLQIIIHFICTIPIEKLCINYCKWQLLYTQLQLTTFVCTVRNDNFCIHCYIRQPQLSTFSSIALHYSIADSYWYYCNRLLVYALLQLLTSVCITSNDNLCMHYCTWQLFYALLQLNLHALLQTRNPTSRRSEAMIITTWITL